MPRTQQPGKSLSRHCPNTPKPYVAVAMVWGETVTLRRANGLLSTIPSASAHHFETSCHWACRICLCLGGIVAVPIDHPLPSVTRHIQHIAPTDIVRIASYWSSIHIPHVTSPPILRYSVPPSLVPRVTPLHGLSIPLIPPRIDISVWPACGIFPFSLRRQPSPHPFAVGIRSSIYMENRFDVSVRRT